MPVGPTTRGVQGHRSVHHADRMSNCRFWIVPVNTTTSGSNSQTGTTSRANALAQIAPKQRIDLVQVNEHTEAILVASQLALSDPPFKRPSGTPAVLNGFYEGRVPRILSCGLSCTGHIRGSSLLLLDRHNQVCGPLLVPIVPLGSVHSGLPLGLDDLRRGEGPSSGVPRSSQYCGGRVFAIESCTSHGRQRATLMSTTGHLRGRPRAVSEVR